MNEFVNFAILELHAQLKMDTKNVLSAIFGLSVAGLLGVLGFLCSTRIMLHFFLLTTPNVS